MNKDGKKQLSSKPLNLGSHVCVKSILPVITSPTLLLSVSAFLQYFDFQLGDLGMSI